MTMTPQQWVSLILMILNAVAGAIVVVKPNTLGIPAVIQTWIGIAQIAFGTALGFLKSVTQS
jgi:uncharacterized membrane protein HdeD (DUF308 family)